MKRLDAGTFTPIYAKTADDGGWPDESCFYVVGSNGLFRCRNHPFFDSSVLAEGGPAELSQHSSFVRLRYPRVPTAAIELIVGFFHAVAKLHGAEAAVLLVWDCTARRMRLMVPDQTSIVTVGWYGHRYADSVHYRTPKALPQSVMLLGDVHSHVDGAAYASWTDKKDEEYRPGLHIVVGRIRQEPPEFHTEVTVDGQRFPVQQDQVMDPYRHRRTDIPQSWLRKVEIVEKDVYCMNQWDQAQANVKAAPQPAKPVERTYFVDRADGNADRKHTGWNAGGSPRGSRQEHPKGSAGGRRETGYGP